MTITSSDLDLIEELKTLTARLRLLTPKDPESDEVAKRIDEINAKLKVVR